MLQLITAGREGEDEKATVEGTLDDLARRERGA
jgi:hypothetical protein